MVNILPHKWMEKALEQANLAAKLGEVPVGAVIICEGQIVGAAHNLTESKQDASAHAEVLAIQQASSNLKRWRLNDCCMYVTLEPCPMCIGAILLARIPALYFGCYDQKLGAVGSLFDLSNHPGIGQKVSIFPSLLETECKTVLKDFFKSRR